MNGKNDAWATIAAHMVRCLDEAIDKHAGEMSPEEAIELQRQRLHLCVDVSAKESLGRYECFERMIARSIDKDLKDLQDGGE